MTLKKKIAAIAVSAALVVSAGALAACSGGGADLTNVYNSGTFTFMSAYPNFTFKQLTTSVQTLKTYSDGTYELTVTSKNISGELAFDPSDSGDTDVSGTNDRGQLVDIYYGTFTSTEEEGFLTVTLSSPTEIVKSATGNVSTGTYYYNTLAWTDAMGQAAAGEGNAALTEEDYLAANAFGQISIVVDTAKNSCNYTSLTVAG